MTLAFAFLLACTPDSITITFSATPVPLALEKLSQATGHKLQASANFRDNVILARLKNAPIQPTLNHLAESLTAKWENKPDGTLLLITDTTAIALNKAQQEQESREKLAGSFQYLDKRLAQMPMELDAKFARKHKLRVEQDEKRRQIAKENNDFANMFVFTGVQEETPGWRAAAKLVKLIGSDQLLKMPNNATQVWAEAPTKMQSAFPSTARTILAQYRRELGVFNPNANPSRIKLFAKRWEVGGAFNIAITAYDPLDTKIDHQYIRLNNDSDQMKIPYNQRAKPEGDSKELPMTINAVALEAREALTTSPKMPKVQEQLAKWRLRILDPIAFEPTQWHLSASLIAMAESLDRNLIGTVDDYISSRYWAEAPEKPTQFLLTRRHLKEASDGFIVAHPANDLNMISREQARALLSKSYTNGGISVDDAAAWIGNSSSKYPSV